MGAIRHPSAYPGLTPSESSMLSRINDFTESFFQDPRFDASHDFDHVKRVVHNATTILEQEKVSQPNLDTFLVLLGALLHDVEDKKYTISSFLPSSPLMDILYKYEIDQRVDPHLVKRLVDGVSYSSEIQNPSAVQQLTQRIPELAIVQDADRLDAIGAIGIGRCFTFSGAKSVRSMDDAIQHFQDKLLKLEGMMKTETGRKMAAERSRRIREFMSWWKAEQPC